MLPLLQVKLALIILCLLCPLSALADTIFTHNFDDLLDLTPVTNQYAGATYQNALAVTSAISLNEIDFPPRSGGNIVMDDGAPLAIFFPQDINIFRGYFTYNTPLTLSFYNGASLLMGQTASSFNNNTGLSGDALSSPNELIAYLNAAGIASMTITGSPDGFSFAGDDFEFTIDSPPDPTAVPEPGSLFLFICGLTVLILRRKS